MKKFVAKESIQRFGSIIFKEGNTYTFDEVIFEGKLYYKTKTSTGEVQIDEREIKRHFVDNTV